MRLSGSFLFAAATAATMLTGCGSDDDVRVVQADRWNHRAGRPKSVSVDPNTVVEATAIVGTGDAARRIGGSISRSGVITFKGVPSGDYVVELRYEADAAHPTDLPNVVQLPVHGDREVRIGSEMWAHHDGDVLADTTAITLNLAAPSGFVDGDKLSFVSIGSYLYVDLTVDEANPEFTNAPAAGATMSTGWRFPASELVAPYGTDGLHLPSASRNDELTLIHSRKTYVNVGPDAGDPWGRAALTRAIGAVTLPSFTLTNTPENAITASLAAPSTTTFAVDFRASSFAEHSAASALPPSAVATARLSWAQEVGDGPGYFTSPAPATWALSASTRRVPANPGCFPDLDNACDPIACAGGCDPTLTALTEAPGDLTRSFEVPRVYTSGMRDVVTASYAFSYFWWHPDSGGGAPVSVSSSVTRLGPNPGPLAATLPPAQNLRMDGLELPHGVDTPLSSSTPTITFDGSPDAEYFAVYVIELRPDDTEVETGDRETRTVATLYTTSGRLTIPERVLRNGHYYYLRVSSRKDGTDFAAPGSYNANDVDRSDIVSGPFTL